MKIKVTICAICFLLVSLTLCSCRTDTAVVTTIQSDTSTTAEQSVAGTVRTTVKESKVSTSATTTKVQSTKKEKSTDKVTTTQLSTTKKSIKTTEKNQQTPTTQKCYITVECKSVLDNMDKLKSGHQAYIPSDGIIMNTCTYEYSTDLTAYNLLKMGCAENDIKLDARSSTYGTYVVGIGNLDEFDCGNESGWTYTVNGKKYPVSCDKYILSPDDDVRFVYTCSY